MKTPLLITSLFLLISLSSVASNASFFQVDTKAIDAKFPSIDSLKTLVLSEPITTEFPIFELPVDSNAPESKMPIMGIPTFFVTFVPTCVVSCIGTPCSGIIMGGTSTFLISQLTDDKEEKNKSFLGCVIGVLPATILYTAYYIFVVSLI